MYNFQNGFWMCSREHFSTSAMFLIWSGSGNTALTWNVNSGTDGYKENILNSAVNVLLVLEQNSSVLLSYKHCFSHYPPESLYLKWLLWCMRLAYIGLHDARSHTYKHNTYIWKLVTTCDCLCSAVTPWPHCQATGVSGSGKAHHDFVILVKLHCDCQFW